MFERSCGIIGQMDSGVYFPAAHHESQTVSDERVVQPWWSNPIKERGTQVRGGAPGIISCV